MKYKNPTFANRYVQMLDYVEQHPRCTMHDCLMATVGRHSSFEMFKAMVDDKLMIMAAKGKHGVFLYEITPMGIEILTRAYNGKWLYEFCKTVRISNATSLTEFDIWLALDGHHEIIEPDSEVMQKLKTAMNDKTSWESRYIKKCIPFYVDLLAYTPTA